MKIAFLVLNFPVLSETFILNQIAGLIDRGHEVHIHPLASPRKEYFSKVHPIVEQYNLLDRTHYPYPVPKKYLGRVLRGLNWVVTNRCKGSLNYLPLLNTFKYEQPPNSTGYLFYKAYPHIAPSYRGWLPYKAIPFLNHRTYDIIHCQFGTLGLIGLLFREIGILEGKIITTFRGHDISKFLRIAVSGVYDQLFAKGDFFLANCEFFRHRVLDLGCEEQKILAHGSGIDCSKFVFTPRYLPPDGLVRISTTGRLVEKKGIEYGIKAIAKLAPIYQNIEYTIIGDGNLKQDLQQLIQELNVSHIVKLVGWKQQQEIIEILNKSHIFVAPSVTAASGDQDAPVNTLKEAMLMGLPVVSTYHGGIPELVEDGISGFLVPERDANAIAEKIADLIEHPEGWVEMGKAGRAKVEETYDMNKLNDELVSIYQQLLNSQVTQRILSKPAITVM